MQGARASYSHVDGKTRAGVSPPAAALPIFHSRRRIRAVEPTPLPLDGVTVWTRETMMTGLMGLMLAAAVLARDRELLELAAVLAARLATILATLAIAVAAPSGAGRQ